MARKRIEIGASAEGQIRALMTRGGTVESITASLHASGLTGVSKATVARRMAEMRSGGATRPPPPPPESEPELPTSPEDIPSGASVPELANLLDRCKAALAQAEADQNLPLVGQMIRVAASLAETMRKATPPERQDPNEHPDMVKLGEEWEARMHKMIDLVCG